MGQPGSIILKEECATAWPIQGHSRFRIYAKLEIWETKNNSEEGKRSKSQFPLAITLKMWPGKQSTVFAFSDVLFLE